MSQTSNNYTNQTWHSSFVSNSDNNAFKQFRDQCGQPIPISEDQQPIFYNKYGEPVDGLQYAIQQSLRQIKLTKVSIGESQRISQYTEFDDIYDKQYQNSQYGKPKKQKLSPSAPEKINTALRPKQNQPISYPANLQKHEYKDTYLQKNIQAPESPQDTQLHSIPFNKTAKTNIVSIQEHDKSSQNIKKMKSYHGTLLKGSDNRKVTLSQQKGAEEKWRFIYLGQSKFYWQSVEYGTYLCAFSDKDVYLSQGRREQAIWIKKKSQDRKRNIWQSSSFKTFLRGYPDGLVDLAIQAKQWEYWVD